MFIREPEAHLDMLVGGIVVDDQGFSDYGGPTCMRTGRSPARLGLMIKAGP